MTLQRFLDAQASHYEDVVSELRSGRKRTHWMWYVFPNIIGLGSSDFAVRYAIRDLAEDKAYLEHPVLGPRLRECTELVVAKQVRFPFPDDLKLRSCLTLFAQVDPWFAEQLRALGLEPDPLTLARI